MIETRWIIVSLILAISGIARGQQGSEAQRMLRQAFEDSGEKTIWQLSFHGSSDSGESLELFMAYSNSLYMAYLKDSEGTLHYFEGKYHPEKLEWVNYEEDIIKGYLIGKRKDGVLSGEWMNSQRTAGKQVYFVQDGSSYADKIPLSGAIYLLTGSLNGNSSTLFMDWQSDGRIRVDLYQKGDARPTQFFRDDHFPSAEDWVFRPDSGDELLHLQSPVFHSRPEAYLEKDKSTIEYGRFELTDQLIRRGEALEGIPGCTVEWIITGKQAMDKRLRQWVKSRGNALTQGKDASLIWFEGTGLADGMIFGKWWADPEGTDILPYISVVLDLRNERIMELSEIFDREKIPGREGNEDQLVLDGGMLCWEGPQHRIIGRTKHCIALVEHLDAVNKKFSSRFKNRH